MANRAIKKGEELVYDYVMHEGDSDLVVIEKCACGSKQCRGAITGKDYLRDDLQKRYAGHFTSWCVSRSPLLTDGR